MMKWRNLKTNPPKSRTKILIRLILDECDEIRGVYLYRRSNIYHVGLESQRKNEYLIDENGERWPYHYASANIYYIPIDELKQIDIDEL